MNKPPRHRPFRVLGARKQLASPERKADGESAKSPRELTFSEAAASAGVRPLPTRPERPERVVQRSPPPAIRAARTLSFTVTQTDDWLEGHRNDLGPSALRRLRVAPSATLDLHGATVQGAQKALVAFLAAERVRGRKLVLVIVGKGRHSAGGQGVLRSEIAAWLTSTPAAAHVVAFVTAPAQWGGSGGVLVLLAATPRAGGRG